MLLFEFGVGEDWRQSQHTKITHFSAVFQPLTPSPLLEQPVLTGDDTGRRHGEVKLESRKLSQIKELWPNFDAPAPGPEIGGCPRVGLKLQCERFEIVIYSDFSTKLSANRG